MVVVVANAAAVAVNGVGSVAMVAQVVAVVVMAVAAEAAEEAAAAAAAAAACTQSLALAGSRAGGVGGRHRTGCVESKRRPSRPRLACSS